MYAETKAKKQIDQRNKKESVPKLELNILIYSYILIFLVHPEFFKKNGRDLLSFVFIIYILVQVGLLFCPLY